MYWNSFCDWNSLHTQSVSNWKVARKEGKIKCRVTACQRANRTNFIQNQFQMENQHKKHNQSVKRWVDFEWIVFYFDAKTYRIYRKKNKQITSWGQKLFMYVSIVGYWKHKFYIVHRSLSSSGARARVFACVYIYVCTHFNDGK